MMLRTIRSITPIVITTLTSTLFLGTYNSVYVISMLTGLILFFYCAACITETALTIQTRAVHHYAIPSATLRLYMPSISMLIVTWALRTPRDPQTLFAGTSIFTASAILLWIYIWGISRHISRKTAQKPLCIHAAHYGISMLAFISPIFYPLSAVRIENLRTILAYNPLAVAIMTTRAAFINDYSAINSKAVIYAVLIGLIIGCAGYIRRTSST